MPGPAEVAALSDLLPPDTSPGRRWLAWIPRPRRRRLAGLAAIPERYRLQFLLLAADRLPGHPADEVTALAGRLADATPVPGRLVAQLPRTDALDQWFKDRREDIMAALDDLLAA